MSVFVVPLYYLKKTERWNLQLARRVHEISHVPPAHLYPRSHLLQMDDDKLKKFMESKPVSNAISNAKALSSLGNQPCKINDCLLGLKKKANHPSDLETVHYLKSKFQPSNIQFESTKGECLIILMSEHHIHQSDFKTIPGFTGEKIIGHLVNCMDYF